MKSKLPLALGLILLHSSSVVTAYAQGTAFTYQGRLNAGGAPANGHYDLGFAVCSGATGANLVSGIITNTATSVSDGLFTATLDFGPGVFDSSPRWLLLLVRTNGGGAFATLAPRQPFTATPYAITASNLSGTVSAAQLSGTVPSAQLAGTYSGAVTLNNMANSFTGTGAALANVNAASLNGQSAANFWQLDGNNVAAGQFLGSTNNQAVEFKVNNLRALRLEPNATSPNLIGGYSGNLVGSGTFGATIGGGGSLNNSNVISATYGTIAGGYANAIGLTSSGSAIAGGYRNTIGNSSDTSTVGGGWDNNIAADSFSATIGGGYINEIGTDSDASTIGGGWDNNIAVDSFSATIAGGKENSITANAWYATIPGGHLNTATNYAFAAGRRAKAVHQGSFVWGDSYDGDVSSTTEDQFMIRASGGVRIYSDTALSAGVRLPSGGTAWAVISDRSVKKDFAPVDGVVILEKLAALPITQWHYQWEKSEITPHIGPMAQDFKAAFYPGSDDKSITTLEADGVAFAAIQGLNEKVEVRGQESEVRMQKLEAENAELKTRLEKLERLLSGKNGGAQ